VAGYCECGDEPSCTGATELRFPEMLVTLYRTSQTRRLRSIMHPYFPWELCRGWTACCLATRLCQSIYFSFVSRLPWVRTLNFSIQLSTFCDISAVLDGICCTIITKQMSAKNHVSLRISHNVNETETHLV
jgi:hypothetical protein